MAMKKKSPIPGLSFSWKRALGITKVKQNISRTTGVPMSKVGIETYSSICRLKPLSKSDKYWRSAQSSYLER